MSRRSFYLLLSVLLLISVGSSLFLGAYRIDWSTFWSQQADGWEATWFLLWHIRLPRILLSGLTGAGLAIVGAAIQGIFRNPLADPTIIGVTSGAMLFAVVAIVLAGSVLAPLAKILQHSLVAMAAFIGGVITTYLVYFLSYRQGKVYVMTMLLAGIAISAFAAAISGLFIYLSDDQQLRDITFWSMGSLGGANWSQVQLAGPFVITAGFILYGQSRALNALLLGEQEASYLGVPVEKVKTRIILISSVVIGCCISMTGLIGFVGLIVPHFLRLIRGTDYRYLLPASALTGAVFLILADTLARTIIAPAELPIGILTAMVGAPFFLWLLLRSQQEKGWL
ncbi:MAG: iron ABC transporter permease [Saprospiraceae bacterium]|nr:iron ABC transporter permease [Lewinella sp.]